jgi:hypothetical protein
MQQDNLAAYTSRFAEIVRGYDDLDATRGNCTDDIFDRLRGCWIEACRWLVEKQYGRVTCERPSEGKPLLLTAWVVVRSRAALGLPAQRRGFTRALRTLAAPVTYSA